MFKLTRSQLKKIIREEISNIVHESGEDFLQDIKSTGEWTDYTIAQLEKKKAALMKKKTRTKPEQEKVSQITFAISAKKGDYKKK